MLFNKKILIWLLGIWSMGIGIRFIISNYLKEIYRVNGLDLIFDWSILTLLGIIIVIISVKDFNNYLKKEEK